jgi:dual specificity MAP kinase phosphatase
MCRMAKVSEISNNVWLGPSPDVFLITDGESDQGEFDLLIEARDLASIPGPHILARIEKQLENGPQRLEFPSSGSIMPPSGQSREMDEFVNVIRWIYYLANPEEPDQEADVDGIIPMALSARRPRKVLMHCADGYTESSLLAIAYFIFAQGVPVHEAWLRLHCERKRNFFAYSSDVTFLKSIQSRLLHESPATPGYDPSHLSEPGWLDKMDGSFPSRILPYMYLGNLNHANNPGMLKALGIRRILSIGEPVDWASTDVEEWGEQNIMFIDQVQDNGIDPLTQEFGRCLEFIREVFRLVPCKLRLTFCVVRDREIGRNRDSSALSGRRLKIGNHLYCGGYGIP